jgi:WhiB family transcriptional regulator, redox-sensing transcriptional regulator
MLRKLPQPRCGANKRAVSEEWDWQLQASCRGVTTEIFFAFQNANGTERAECEERAKRLCRSCPVQQCCLLHAVQYPECYGIWGAMTPRERESLRSGPDDPPDARGGEN